VNGQSRDAGKGEREQRGQLWLGARDEGETRTSGGAKLWGEGKKRKECAVYRAATQGGRNRLRKGERGGKGGGKNFFLWGREEKFRKEVNERGAAQGGELSRGGGRN